MSFTPGFAGTRRNRNPNLPPGQYEVNNFPVLTIGPTPVVATTDWSLELRGEAGDSVSWTWDDLMGLPADEFTTDLHCVTAWSQFGMPWKGVSLDTLLTALPEHARSSAHHVLASCYGGYTTNVRYEDITDGKAWIAYEYNGAPLAREHGGPARLLIPHLYLWKSAKWVNRIQLLSAKTRGFWEVNGYHDVGDPWKEQRYS